MDINSIITVAVILVIVYFIIKFIISPLVKLIAGIIIVLIAIYILQNYFNINLNQYLGPLSPYLSINKWIQGIDWIVGLIISYITQGFAFLRYFKPK